MLHTHGFVERQPAFERVLEQGGFSYAGESLSLRTCLHDGSRRNHATVTFSFRRQTAHNAANTFRATFSCSLSSHISNSTGPHNSFSAIVLLGICLSGRHTCPTDWWSAHKSPQVCCCHRVTLLVKPCESFLVRCRTFLWRISTVCVTRETMRFVAGRFFQNCEASISQKAMGAPLSSFSISNSR